MTIVNEGVKANVLFFDRKPAAEKRWTEKLWIYDLRTNKHFTLKENPLKRSDLDDHPLDVRRLLAEAVAQMDDLMFAENELMETASQLGREIVVEKESQAARRVSNSTASRTSASDTSNQ